ncbi:MBL fold metallo-hydrolase [bacterium]|nr:MBL fold metallo-hydrolase [bacterium]
MLSVERFICGPLQNNVYLLVDDTSNECAVIDPGIDCQVVIEAIRNKSLTTRYILLTHGHFDHVFSLADFKRELGAQVVMHPADEPLIERLSEVSANWGFPGASPAPPPDIELAHGQRLDLGETTIEVRHTPGHSPGQVAFITGGNAFVGDTLFWRGIGRYDLPGSDFAALVRSITEQLYTLPGATIVWPGHGQETTVDEERRLNPYVGDGARFKPQI